MLPALVNSVTRRLAYSTVMHFCVDGFPVSGSAAGVCWSAEPNMLVFGSSAMDSSKKNPKTTAWASLIVRQ